MSLDLSFKGGEPEDERNKRIIKILKEFSRLSPEMQEAVIKYAESLGKEKSEGQNPHT